MRATLILALTWSWLCAAPRAELGERAPDRLVAASGGPGDDVLVARIQAADLGRPLAARAHSPSFIVLAAAPVGSTAPDAATDERSARPADLARTLRVSAHPREPRAPPPARS